MKIKVKDIAQVAGVSPATVSLVLNNKPSRISPTTQEHIRSVARELQMRQGATFAFDTTVTRTIGFIISDIRNSYFNTLSNSIEEYMSRV